MKLGKRTAQLVREAAVMAFVQGSLWGKSEGRNEVMGFAIEPHPRDSVVLRNVLRAARSNSDLYPLLSKAEIDGVQVERTAEEWAELRSLLGIDSPGVSSQEETNEGETGSGS